MFRYACVSFVILGSFLVSALSNEEGEKMHAFIEEAVKTCAEEFGIDFKDVTEAKKNHKLEDFDPCFFGCILKSNKLIDDKGMYDPKQGYALSENFIKTADELAKVKKVTEICTSVNEKKVNDGSKGCERSVLLINCLIENSSLFM